MPGCPLLMRLKLTLFLGCLPSLLVLTGCGRENSAAATAANPLQSAGGDDKIIPVNKDDPEMVAAIAKARSTLPQFWQTFDHPGPDDSDFSLKVRITDKSGAEHFWVTHIERPGGLIFAVINNDADIVKSVKLGDRIPVPEANISDWMYMHGGKIVGNYTLRAEFKLMPPSEVAKYKEMLADP